MLNVFDAFLMERVPAVRRIWKALSVSFLNQAVSSGTNFLLSVFFVRFMDPEAFGIYGISIAAVLLFSGVGNALILTQMVVHLPDRAAEEVPAYLGNNLILVAGLSLIGMILIATIWVVDQFFPYAGIDRLLLLATGLAASGYLLKDYFIRVSYSARREAMALAINTAVAITTVAVLISFWSSGHSLDASAAVGIFAVGQLAGAVAGLAACWPLFRFHGSHGLADDLRESLRGGRWALGGVFVTWLQSQAYVYMTAIFVGPVGVGYANAARLFVSPLQLVMPAINQLTMPRLASLRTEAKDRVAATGQAVTALVVIFAVVYVCMLALFYPYAADLLLDDRYHGVGAIVVAWCAVLLFQLIRDGASTILQTLRKFRRLTVSGAVVVSLSVPLTAAFSKMFGATGAVAATAIAELALALVLWRWINSHARSH